MQKSLIIYLIATGVLFFGGCGESRSGDNDSLILESNIEDDHDDHHITFINQTKYTLKFGVDISFRPDKHKTLDNRSANYLYIDDCYDGDGNKKTFEITVKKVESLNDDVTVVSTHRKCGENLYVWHEDGEFKHNDEPHIQADLSGCDDNTSKPAILFAHGYNDTQLAWGHFALLAEDAGWRVFRTSVSQDGSIKKRAHMLNAYINKIADQCKIHNNTLRVVGHSMGGLDLRYLISEPLGSQQYVERFYTIATPHQGDGYGYFASVASDAGRNLTPSYMKSFNKAYPYSSITDHNISLLAIRFACSQEPNEGDSDFVVEVKDQHLPDAPYSSYIYHGKHMPSALCVHGYDAEQEQDWLLHAILKDHAAPDDICEIPYVHNNTSVSCGN
jgi:triacylglycerol lipase